jgi:hypothetical protein
VARPRSPFAGAAVGGFRFRGELPFSVTVHSILCLTSLICLTIVLVASSTLLI